MKRFIFAFLCAMLVTITANAQQTYKHKDIEGIWLVTEGYDENAKQWVSYGGNEAQAWAFMSETSRGKHLALLSTNSGVSTFVYTLNKNKVLLRDIDDDLNVLVTIKIISLERGKCFIGRISTKDSPNGAKFKFSKIDEKE